MRPFQATFIGIGAQKCASTWAYGVFQQMPQVQVSDVKEVDFFSYYFDRGYEWYERHFASQTPVMHRGEISPSYFIDSDAPARAAAYNPDLHVLVTLRDPVARAYSNHLHEVRKSHISGDNLVFETALENNPLYLEQGRYATHLARWLDHFPAERVHVIFQEDIHQDRKAMADRLADLMGLPRLEDFLDQRANESVRYRNPLVGETLYKVGSFARKKGLGKVVEGVKAAPGIRQMRDANREELRSVIAPMTAETKTRLRDFYAPEVETLQRMIGQPAPWARFADS
jgi:hypothetical protein